MTSLLTAAGGAHATEERADERGPQTQERRGPGGGRDGGGGDEGEGGRDILPRGSQVSRSHNRPGAPEVGGGDPGRDQEAHCSDWQRVFP